MQTLQPVLLCGHYEWQRDLQPATEFESRLTAVVGTMQRQNWDALIVHGNSRDNAALCHLTNMVPNQRWGLALIAPEARPQIVASVGARDRPAVQRLTWIEDIHTSTQVGPPLTQWLASLAGGQAGVGRSLRIAVAGLAQMRANVGREVVGVCGGFGEMVDATPTLAALRRAKSPHEIALLRESHRLLRTAFAEIEQRRRVGAAMASALLAAERSVRLAGAQDVRMLCGTDTGGPLRPVSIDGPAASHGTWCVYFAVRFCGYWSEGLATLTTEPSPAARAARAALVAATGAARIGATGQQLYDAMAPHLEGFGRSPMLGAKIARPHGLALDTDPWIEAHSTEPLRANNAYVIAATAVDANEQQALESTTVVLDQPRPDVLDPSPFHTERRYP